MREHHRVPLLLRALLGAPFVRRTGCDHPFIPDRRRLAQAMAKVEAMKTAREREADQMEIVF